MTKRLPILLAALVFFLAFSGNASAQFKREAFSQNNYGTRNPGIDENGASFFAFVRLDLSKFKFH